MLKRFINVIALLTVGALGASAAVVKGVVTDLSGEPLPQATVKLIRANADSTFVGAAATDINGHFSIPDIGRGRYILRAIYIGYNQADANLRVGSDAKTVTADTLRLTESSILLKEAVAIGVATPVKVMEDTIEYNASSYTTPPNAVVSDLLKRLPGVEVESDGSIKAQGETVKKILIDGEEFFSDDPKVASKNIPVDMIKSAQVITRKSDLARMTGVDDGEDETVINLTVKEGRNKGWYGTVAGGYGLGIDGDGTVDAGKYKGSFIVNGMFGKNSITILGNANNVNDEGFTDNNGQRFRRFGGNTGINTTQSLGVNFNLGTTKLRYGGNIMYSHNDRHNWRRSHTRNIFNDGENTFDDSESDTRDRGHNVNANLRLKWEPDSFNTFDFRPNFSLNFNNSESSSFGVNYRREVTDPTTNSRTLNSSDGKSYNFDGRLIYNHKVASHPGRSFSISGNYSFSNTHEDERNWSRNAYWLFNDSLYEDYQEIHNHTWNNSVNGRLSWTEPLGNVARGNFMEVAYMMSYRWNNADKTVYNDPYPAPAGALPSWREYDWSLWGFDDRLAGLDDLTLSDSLSNSFRNAYFNQQLRIGYRKVTSKLNLNVGLSFNPQMSRSTNLTNEAKTIPTRWVWNYAPFLRFRYKFSRQTTLNAFYNGRSSQPSMTQLQPVADYSNPMNIVIGNPDLNPSFNHNLRVRFQTFNPDNQQSVMVMGFASFTQNAIATNVTTDRQTGARTTTYENVNGNWNFGAFSIFSRPLPNKVWTFNNNLHFNYRQTVGFTDGISSRSNRTQIGESFAIAFRPNNLELELRPRYDVALTSYTNQRNSNSTIHTYGASFNGTYYTPFGLVLSSDLTYSNSTGYSAGYDSQQWMLNASLSYMFLRGKNATIAIEGRDLLNQVKSITRSETAQAISDVQNLVLGRYVMMTFTYKFSTFAGGKNPARSNDDDFMRGGPGGPGGFRPGGGPGGPGPR